MATPTDIGNEINELNEKWEAPNAHNGLFGNLLGSIKVQQVRGMSVDVEFSWPVRAIASTNGSAKTTLLQLCPSAYVSPEGRRSCQSLVMLASGEPDARTCLRTAASANVSC